MAFLLGVIGNPLQSDYRSLLCGRSRSQYISVLDHFICDILILISLNSDLMEVLESFDVVGNKFSNILLWLPLCLLRQV